MRITFGKDTSTIVDEKNNRVIIKSGDQETECQVAIDADSSHKDEKIEDDTIEDDHEGGVEGGGICSSLKKNGQPCNRLTKPGDSYCFYHMNTCTGITSRGTKCYNGCMEGTNRCGYHAATCPGLTKAGEPCQLAAEFCRYHRFASVDDEENLMKHERSPKTQCHGLTKKGQKCRLRVAEEQKYCHFHQ